MAESLATMTPAPSHLPFGLQALLDAFFSGVEWMSSQVAPPGEEPILRLIAGDASDRKFFRLENTNESAICMQFPKWEGGYGGDPLSWLGMHDALAHIGLPVPRVLLVDEPNLCIWTEDFGDDFLHRTLGDRVFDVDDPGTAHTLRHYEGAIDLLVDAQYPRTSIPEHPAKSRFFDYEKLHFEMRFFLKHLVHGFLGIAEGDTRVRAVESELSALCQTLDACPRVLCHRDYHARNVMVVNDEPRWIDFQDARMGPHTYDVVSLVRDSYVRITDATRARLYDRYFNAVTARQVELGLAALDRAEFDVELLHMGLQRNVKALGSFGYLATEKRKPSYLQYVPHTLSVLLNPNSTQATLHGVDLTRTYPATYGFLAELHTGSLKKLLEARLEECKVAPF